MTALLIALALVAAIWIFRDEKLDWLQGLIMPAITTVFAIAALVFIILLIKNGSTAGYPPLPEGPYGPSEAAPISVGNEARDR